MPRIETINDWKPETRALLNRVTAAGYKILRGDNGEERFEFTGDLEAFLDQLLATDETLCDVLHPNGTKRIRMFLVLGNDEPGLILCDYTAYDGRLDAIADAHYEEWSAKAQPKLTGYYDERCKFVVVPGASTVLKLAGNPVVIQSEPEMFK